MNKPEYRRLVQTSVTVFITRDDKYLFLKRNMTKRIDPGRLNGVGGRLEPGEDYLTCCIREVEEETGYKITPEEIELSGIVKLQEGYPEDWVMCFFKVKVSSFTIPKGTHTEDGELIWIDKDKVLDSEYDLVDDLQYCFKDMVAGKRLFFLTATLNSEEKVAKTSIAYLEK